MSVTAKTKVPWPTYNKDPGTKKGWDKDLCQKVLDRKDIIKKRFNDAKNEARSWLNTALLHEDSDVEVSDIEAYNELESDDEEKEERSARADEETRKKMKHIDESKEAQQNLVDEELRPGDKIRYHDPRAVKGGKSKREAIMLRIREGGLTEEQQTPLELDNRQGSLFKGGDFPKMRLETWDKKKRKLVPTPEAVNRPLKTLTLVEREAPQKVEMPGGLSKEQLKELEKQKEKALEVFNQPVDDDDESSESSTDSWFENRKDESTPASKKAKKFSSAIKKPKCSCR